MMQTDMIEEKKQIDLSSSTPQVTLSKGDEDQGGRDGDSGTVTLTRTKTQKPSMYKVLLLNDDYTPMEFVIYVLQRFFSKSAEDATKVMLQS